MAANVRFVQGLSTNFYVVDSETGVRSFKKGFTPDAGTLYFLIDTKELYKGSILFASGDAAADAAALAARMTTAEGNINVLKGDKNTEGSVAYQIAQIVAGADENFDTLKEIADWIKSDTAGAAKMASDISQNASDIDALETLVGTTAVATQISNAIDGLDADKTSAAVEAGKGIQVQVTEVDGKLTSVSVSGSYDNAYDAKGDAAQALVDAKNYANGLNTSMNTRVSGLESTVGKAAKGKDPATGLVKKVADLESAIGENGSVATQIKNAIEALDVAAGTVGQAAGADGLALDITQVDGKITSISGSIAAETYDAYGSAASEETRAKGVEGDLTALTTEAKASLVAAINEVDANADAAAQAAAAASTKVDTKISKLDATITSDDVVDGGIAVKVVETDGKITDVEVSADFSSYALKTYAESEADAAEAAAKSYADGLLTWGSLA